MLEAVRRRMKYLKPFVIKSNMPPIKEIFGNGGNFRMLYFKQLINFVSKCFRSAITIFPQRMNGKEFRIWNQQLISYAGYTNRSGNENELENGPTDHKSAIIGDPINVEFTQVGPGI